jgi:hypothetical protein
MTRCCLCRQPESGYRCLTLEPTTLPGGYRCVDRDACRERVQSIVNAHKGLGEVCGG